MIVQPRPPERVQGIAGDLAAALDPVVFARRAGIDPDPWQAEVLRSGSSRVLMNCSRQSGKSTVSAVLAMHQASYVPASLILLLAPAGRQSKELLAKIKEVWRDARPDGDPDTDNHVELRLDNGSRVVVIPAKQGNIRGFSAVDLIVIDESAWVPDDVYKAVRPMLAVSGGRLIALSTPWGRRGWWYDAWAGAQPWDRVQVTALDCPRITPEFLQEEREALGEFAFNSEYMCSFEDSEGAAFRGEDIERAQVAESVEEWTWL